jgi:DNA (cytosine-5)-methyltransferase 1
MKKKKDAGALAIPHAPLTYGSICSGIEAASTAWEPLGMRPLWFSEIEPYPCSVLAYRYPNVPNVGDMTTIARRILTGEIEAPDVLVGGPPCQAFSLAGLREGLDDERGQLTICYVRLLDAIDYVRGRAGKPPCIAVYENVPGILSDRTGAFGCLVAGLAGEDAELKPPGKKWTHAGCVFGPQRAAAWRIFDAQYFGLAQQRKRVFLVASARKGFDPSAVLFEWDGVRRDSAPSRSPQTHVAALTANGVGTCGADDNQAQAGHLIAQPVGFPEGAARTLLAKGNDSFAEDVDSYVVQEASTGDISHCLNAGGMGRQDFETETLVAQVECFTDTRGDNRGSGIQTTGDIANTLHCAKGISEQQAVAYRVHGENSNAMKGGGDASVADPVDVARCLDTQGGFTHNQGGNVVLQGVAIPILEVGNRTGASTTDVRAGMGIAEDGAPMYTLTACAQHGVAHGVCVTGEVTHTLKAEGFDASEDGTGRGQPIVPVQYTGEFDGELVNGARQGEGCVSCGAVLGMREAGRGSTSQESELARSLAGESSAPLSRLPSAGASLRKDVHVVPESAQGAGVLCDALSEVQEARGPGDCEGQPAHEGEEGFGKQPGCAVLDIGMRSQASFARVLCEACSTEQARHTWLNERQQVGSNKEGVGRASLRIRRLMPVECELLQGFHPGYTLVPHRGKPAADGPRYKALGNSMAVPCMHWIGLRIKQYLNNELGRGFL